MNADQFISVNHDNQLNQHSIQSAIFLQVILNKRVTI